MSVRNKMIEQKDPTMSQIVWSVLCSFFGVSNKTNFDRDRVYLEKVGFKPYLYAAIILTIVFVLSVWTVVKIVLSNAGM
jgi:hypothetical protein